jgi:hypothetical protein
MTMQTVITANEARAITGKVPSGNGGGPFLPVPYETAIRCIRECLTIDDAKYWDNFTDAQAAWAKIHHDDELLRLSKVLKLHASRRMGQLARRDAEPVRSLGRGKGKRGGPMQVFRAYGVEKRIADAAIKLSSITQAEFSTLCERRNPPSPMSAANNLYLLARGTDSWRAYAQSGHIRPAAIASRRLPSKAMAKGMSPDELKIAVKEIQELADWCDEFLQAAGK